MLTCETCGKTNGGHGVVWTNWICKDCRVEIDHPDQLNETERCDDSGAKQ